MTDVLPAAGATEPLSGEIAAPDDPFDTRLALEATGVLRTFNESGMLTAADVHVAVRLCELGGETDESVRLALALTVRAVRSGSVCLDLEQVRHQVSQLNPALPWPDPGTWPSAVQASPLVGAGKPLRWEYGLLYLDRYRRQEEQVRRDLLARQAQPPPTVDRSVLADGLRRLFPDEDAQQQRRAAQLAALRWTTVLGGGPGTGKTTTVARVLALLLDQPGPPLRVALAAPTGKAAARLQAAVQHEADTFAPRDRHDLPGMTASTLHRLLGWVPGGGQRFRHNRDNRLPYDVVVVDETSMVSLTMMARLTEAVRPDARLILVGDPDQLASVEAGAVLADLVAGLTTRAASPGGTALAPEPDGAGPRAGESAADASAVVLLRKTFRFGGAIARLAAAVRDGDPDGAVEVLGSGQDEVVLVEPDDPEIRTDVRAAASAVRACALRGDAVGALEQLDGHRLLCAHRSGDRGVQDWTRRIENWLADDHDHGRDGEWYAGRPVLVMSNDYSLGLFNGDTGVVVRDDDALRAVFTREGRQVDFAPRRLADVQTVHAMTVHRSQGSQFRRVTFVLPQEKSLLSTRELLYTALTRAQTFVRLVGSEAELRAAICTPAARASGLRLRLADTR